MTRVFSCSPSFYRVSYLCLCLYTNTDFMTSLSLFSYFRRRTNRWRCRCRLTNILRSTSSSEQSARRFVAEESSMIDENWPTAHPSPWKRLYHKRHRRRGLGLERQRSRKDLFVKTEVYNELIIVKVKPEYPSKNTRLSSKKKMGFWAIVKKIVKS